MKRQDPVLLSDSLWRVVVQPENSPAERPRHVSLQMHHSDILLGHDIQIARKDTETIVQEKEGDKHLELDDFINIATRINHTTPRNTFPTEARGVRGFVL